MRIGTAVTLAASLIVAAPMAAQAVTVVPSISPTSYSYIVAPNNSGSIRYRDESGSDLIDGIAATGHWNTQEASRNGPNVGWYTVDPTIEFYFDQLYDFTSITMNIQDTNGSGGVGIAEGITINGLNYAITSPGANGAVDLSFDISSLSDTDTLLVTVDRRFNWTFLSEFTFEGVTADVSAVPVPAGLPLLLAGLGGLALVRRRKSKG
jgi:hypothetical protein